MKLLHALAPTAVVGVAAVHSVPVGGRARRSRIVLRLAALGRLLRRRRRARVDALPFLNAAALRELGLSERAWISIAADAGDSIAARRRAAQTDFLLSPSSRFVVRGIDSAL